MHSSSVGADDEFAVEPARWPAPGSELKELVMGLHWHPSGDGAPANLDASCVLLDAQQRIVDVVHPGHARNHSDSVVHTGDEPIGASEWDDERIFVFLEALPQQVDALAFVVASADGRPFGDVPGASCHVSDRVTERAWLHVDLTALGPRTRHCVALLRRESTGWILSTDVPESLLAELRLQAAVEGRN